MRNIKHHSIIVTSGDREKIEWVRQQAILFYQQTMEAKNGKALVSPISLGLINNFYSFYIIPDGSKEGYDISEDGDMVREKICLAIESLKGPDGTNPVNYVEVYFGADEGTAGVIRHN